MLHALTALSAKGFKVMCVFFSDGWLVEYREINTRFDVSLNMLYYQQTE